LASLKKLTMVVVLVSEVGSLLTGRTILVEGGMTDYSDFGHVS
jgi:hypothetical protein